MRFLILELDGRTTLDRTRQGLYGVVMGQHATGPHAAVRAQPSAPGPGRNRRQIPSLLRLLRPTLQPQSPGVAQAALTS